VTARLERSVCLCGAALLVIGSSAAISPTCLAQEDDAEAVRLSYSALGHCPDEADFSARVRARTTRVRFAQPGETVRRFDVTLFDGAPASGQISVVDAEGPHGVRRVRAATCAEVADAIALVVALAVNPETPAPAHPASVPERTGTRMPGASGPLPPQQTGITPAGVTSTAGRVFAGADLALNGGVTPDVLAAVSPYLGWQATDGTLAPELRLSAIRSMSNEAVSNGQASFVWTAGRLDGCPVAWQAAALRVAPCARIEAGAIEVETTGVPAPRTRLRGWFAAGVLIRAEWSLVDALFADAELAALVRASNDRFVVLPDTTLYQVQLIGLGAGLGLGARFP
jgi:hypothetical protein